MAAGVKLRYGDHLVVAIHAHYKQTLKQEIDVKIDDQRKTGASKRFTAILCCTMSLLLGSTISLTNSSLMRDFIAFET